MLKYFQTISDVSATNTICSKPQIKHRMTLHLLDVVNQNPKSADAVKEIYDRKFLRHMMTRWNSKYDRWIDCHKEEKLHDVCDAWLKPKFDSPWCRLSIRIHKRVHKNSIKEYIRVNSGCSWHASWEKCATLV